MADCHCRPAIWNVTHSSTLRWRGGRRAAVRQVHAPSVGVLKGHTGQVPEDVAKELVDGRRAVVGETLERSPHRSNFNRALGYGPVILEEDDHGRHRIRTMRFETTEPVHL